MEDLTREFRSELGQSVASTRRALQILEGRNEANQILVCSGRNQPKRSNMYRILLARALRILLGLYEQEREREINEKNGTVEQSC